MTSFIFSFQVIPKLNIKLLFSKFAILSRKIIVAVIYNNTAFFFKFFHTFNNDTLRW